MNPLAAAALHGICLLALAVSPAVLADLVNETQQVAGMRFHFGIVPAQIVQKHQPGHAEREMHKGAPSGRSQYHVMVAIFDAKSGVRITDAAVKARVEGIGPVSGQEKPLEPMLVADAMTYGNFFDMAGTESFRVVLEVRRPGEPGAAVVRFEHKHR
jgi:hypothetical protein